ncbi:hypothetical protein [Sulfitobacter donghicola]|nr:hypothetical protein [Sulfitobacter donghicola]KIN69471.1 hypothetical protein Z948_3213 [Sulfitobacter donghicola DSW-25 = KCTC 12864 = JCM 14565]
MLNPIVRRSDFVRQLTPNTVIDANDAFIDRIDLDIGDWLLSGELVDICGALSQLRLAEIPNVDGGSVPLFNSHIVERFYEIRGLRFSTNPRTDSLNQASALISGTVERPNWRYRPTTRQPGETERISFKTQLNLTRFLQAQRLHHRSRSDRPRLASNYVMAISPETSWYADEVPLLPATNVIIGPNKKYAFALKDSRSVQMQRYLNIAQDMLNNAMQGAFDGEGASAHLAPYFSLRAIEFYWEFDAESPIDFVASLRERVMQHGQVVSEDFYDISTGSLRTTNQSPCLTVQLTSKIKVKIYAKTTRRVRFEVTIKDDAINVVAGQRSQASVEGIVSLIPSLAQEAADRLAPLIQSITAAPPPPGRATALQLMHLITQNAQDRYVAEAIIAALVSFGRVAAYGNDPMKSAIRGLKERGILRSVKPRSSICVITDEYHDALISLRRYR